MGSMDRGDIEQLALDFYERHGLDPEEPETSVRLARLELGPSAVTRGDLRRGSPGATGVVHGRTVVVVARRLTPEWANFVVGHELAHVLLDRAGLPSDEASADYLGAALMAPRPAVLRLHRHHGLDVERLADEVVGTQTWAALRLGETLGMPMAAVSPLRVRVRGPEAWEWGTEAHVRALATGRRQLRGVVKVGISDERGRAALFVDEDDLEGVG